uniref:tRNA (Uracil5)methyltransferase putative n=1 Tax=Albugo laibachii Nc14 TaxID=890382 RepID=F0WG95_9STRA|nr:tRNA (uracil5)methyltransferase putative [Albugo laibachii Nc14]|eukprot:CCA20230.1 tRNA (uracil5)methyltransferase putative [Albugo laibachii Nc14]
MSADDDLKIIVLNFGKWKESKCMEDFLTENQVEYSRVKKVRHQSYGFILFETEETKEQALSKLQGLKWKEKLLEVKSVLPKRSLKPLKKRKKITKDEETDDLPSTMNGKGTQVDPAEAIDASDAVTPWATIPYQDQLEKKNALLKRALVRMVRHNRKEYTKKEKRALVQQQKRSKNERNSSCTKLANSDEPKKPSLPLWLESRGLFHFLCDGKIFTTHSAPASECSNWTHLTDAAEVISIVSFGAELIAAKSDGNIYVLNKSLGKCDSSCLCAAPSESKIVSLASCRDNLYCCTKSGTIYRRVGSDTQDPTKWEQLAKFSHAALITIFNGFMIACVYHNDLKKSIWYRAELNFSQSAGSSFQSYDVEVTDPILGLTSHDAQLIILTEKSLLYANFDGKVCNRSDTGLDKENAIAIESFAIHKGLCCPFESIEPSPVTEGYRNKCEFTLGFSEADQPCVGFRLGLFKKGSVIVSDPGNCINVSPIMKKVCEVVQKMITASNFPVFNVETREGVWKQLAVRHSTRTQQLMVVMQVNMSNLDDSQQTNLQKVITDGLVEALDVTSLYMQAYQGSSGGADQNGAVKLLHGNPVITEKLFDLEFNISPEAFFQVNTDAAEILYAKVREMVQVNKKTLLYDVCCGTGTIGLCCAKDAGKVIGIEICKAATEDAERNAILNQIKNISFVNDKAEEVMKDILQTATQYEGTQMDSVTVVIDPPRAGLHYKVLRALRACPVVRRIVYVSCNPTQSLIQDSAMLCGPKTSALVGEAFCPVRAAAVDMFPHTPHCEMIVVFERGNSGAI